MSKTMGIVAAAVALACAAPLRAHHNGSMFDPTPIWVKGTVVSYERVNPHATIALEEARAERAGSTVDRGKPASGANQSNARPAERW